MVLSVNPSPHSHPLRIGTRKSPMALAQTERVRELLLKLEPDLGIDVVPIETEADQWQGDLSKLGGKGLFVKAIDLRLQSGDIDLAVHCLKDVPGDGPLPEGLVFAAMLSRDDARDVLVVPEDSAVRTLADLPAGAHVGSSSVRRRAQLGRARPDLRVVRVRGTVGTRLDKLDGTKAMSPALDALVVAASGLERLELRARARHTFTVDEILPAVGAGVLVLECRRADGDLLALLRQLGDARTLAEATAERAMLYGLRGHCNSPIAGYCDTEVDGRLSLRGMVFDEAGSTFVRAHIRGPADDPVDLGGRVSTELLRQGAAGLIAGTVH